MFLGEPYPIISALTGVAGANSYKGGRICSELKLAKCGLVHLQVSSSFSFANRLSLWPTTCPGHAGNARIKLSRDFAKTSAEALSPVIYNCRIKRAGIAFPEEGKLRLGYSKTPMRDALVKEFKASLLGKTPPFPEEDLEQRKKNYLAFLLREEA